MNLALRRTGELTALMMIGDGVLATAWPRRHVRLWEQGPPLWRKLVRPFARHPQLTRALGAAEIAAGIALAWAMVEGRPNGSAEDRPIDYEI